MQVNRSTALIHHAMQRSVVGRGELHRCTIHARHVQDQMERWNPTVVRADVYGILDMIKLPDVMFPRKSTCILSRRSKVHIRTLSHETERSSRTQMAMTFELWTVEPLLKHTFLCSEDNSPIQTVKESLGKKMGWHPSCIRLVRRGAEVFSLAKEDYDGESRCFAILGLRHQHLFEFDITFRIVADKVILTTVRVNGCMNLGDLLAKLADVVGKDAVEKYNYSFIFNGRKLKNDFSIAHYKLKQGSKIKIVRGEKRRKKNVHFTIRFSIMSGSGSIGIPASFGTNYRAGAIKVFLYKLKRLPQDANFKPSNLHMINDRTNVALFDDDVLSEDRIQDGDVISVGINSGKTQLFPVEMLEKLGLLSSVGKNSTPSTLLADKSTRKKTASSNPKARKCLFGGFKKGFLSSSRREKKRTSKKRDMAEENKENSRLDFPRSKKLTPLVPCIIKREKLAPNSYTEKVCQVNDLPQVGTPLVFPKRKEAMANTQVLNIVKIAGSDDHAKVTMQKYADLGHDACELE